MKTGIDLLSILSDAGVNLLRQGSTEIWGSCPLHEKRTGHPDHRPSWSINRVTFVHNCFSCGYAGTLTSLLVDLLGHAPEDLEAELSEHSFLHKMAEVREQPEQVLDPIIPLLTDWTLVNVLADVPQRLLDLRRLDRKAIDVYQVRWDHDTRRWVLPLRSPFGVLVGAQYRQKGAVYTLPEGMEKSLLLFGLTQTAEFDYVVLVESPLDAVRLFGLGIPALSSLGAWVSIDQIRLMARTFSTVYLALDDDDTGRKAAEFVAPSLRRAGCAAVPWVYECLTDEEGRQAKDVGDAADDEMIIDAWHRTQRWGLS